MENQEKKFDELSDQEFEKLSNEGLISSKPDEPAKEETQAEDSQAIYEEEQKAVEPKAGEEIEEKEPPHVSYDKYKKEKERRKELEAEQEKIKQDYEDRLASLSSKMTELETIAASKNIEGDIDAFVEKTGFEKGTVTELIDILKRHSGVPTDINKRLELFEQQQAIMSDKLAFEKDFMDNVLPKIKQRDPEINQERIDEIKGKIAGIAYKEENLNVPLPYIYAFHESDLIPVNEPATKKKSAEGSRIGQTVKTNTDYSNISAEDMSNMSDEEFLKYSEYLEKTTGRVQNISRNGRKIN
jgi:hypothetical protein